VEAVATKPPDDGAGRAGARKGVKHEPNGLLHLLIGIENDPVLRIIDQAHWQGQPQLPASRLVAKAPLEASPQYMEFFLGKRSLHAQQKSIVKMGRIIEAIFIEDQRFAQSTEFE
jgi:hypothetical protein